MERTSTIVSLEGVTIAYRDSGPAGPVDSQTTATNTTEAGTAGVPIVLVHGMGGDGHTWNRFARALLDRGRRVIIVDLRGHGRSARTPTYLFDEFAHDILRLCDNLGLDRVDLVGHSLGGYAASVIAQIRPELVRRLVIEESPLPRRPTDPPATLTSRFPTLPELWHATTSLVRHPRAVLAFDRSMTSSALEQFRTPNPDWWHRLPNITAPTLFLAGGPTGMVDPDKLAAAAEQVRECTVIRMNTGHSIHRDHYRAFANAVLPFLTAR